MIIFFFFLVVVVMSAVSGLQGEVPGFGTSGYLFPFGNLWFISRFQVSFLFMSFFNDHTYLGC